mgnify:CR=1 FL=1
MAFWIIVFAIPVTSSSSGLFSTAVAKTSAAVPALFIPFFSETPKLKAPKPPYFFVMLLYEDTLPFAFLSVPFNLDLSRYSETL